MGRATYGAARHRKKVRVLKDAKGFRGAAGKHWRQGKETIIRAGVNAYRDRRTPTPGGEEGPFHLAEALM